MVTQVWIIKVESRWYINLQAYNIDHCLSSSLDDIKCKQSACIANSNSTRPLEEGEEIVEIQPRKKTRFEFLEKKILTHQKKIVNPFVKLFEHAKIAKALKCTEQALHLNSHNYEKTFSPILNGFESSRPDRNYKTQEIEENKDKSDNKKLDLPKMSTYKIQDDPIQFEQNFLVTVNKTNKSPSRIAI